MVSFDLTSEQKAIQEAARTFAVKEIRPVAAELDRTMEYPHDLFAKAHAQGLINGSVPSSLGGVGLSLFEHTLIHEEISFGCSGVGTAFCANDLAIAPLLVSANQDQKEEFIRPMTESPIKAAYCVRFCVDVCHTRSGVTLIYWWSMAEKARFQQHMMLFGN
jgi:acyl-CoA dehydrogenase